MALELFNEGVATQLACAVGVGYGRGSEAES